MRRREEPESRVADDDPESAPVDEAPPVVEVGKMVTLVCPEGAFDAPISHGTRSYYPYRADTSSTGREYGGPWRVDVPFEEYHYFVGRSGFYVYDPEKKS